MSIYVPGKPRDFKSVCAFEICSLINLQWKEEITFNVMVLCGRWQRLTGVAENPVEKYATGNC